MVAVIILFTSDLQVQFDPDSATVQVFGVDGDEALAPDSMAPYLLELIREGLSVATLAHGYHALRAGGIPPPHFG